MKCYSMKPSPLAFAMGNKGIPPTRVERPCAQADKVPAPRRGAVRPGYHLVEYGSNKSPIPNLRWVKN
jgi:hypothetical protein